MQIQVLGKHVLQGLFFAAVVISTRFGPKRVAADMEGNGEFNFERFIRILGDILEDFLENF